MLDEDFILVSGCSHTSGVAIEKKEIWAQCVVDQLGIKLVNLARPGACAKYVSESLSNWLIKSIQSPKFVIAQWPNPYRSMIKTGDQIKFFTTQSTNQDFIDRLRHCPESFVEEWYNSIIALNSVCKVPVVNIYLQDSEPIVDVYLTKLKHIGIEVHIDQKLPNKTWHFDSAASDGLHHSAVCHQKWANRVLTILDHSV